ncbi:hypothetical protein A2U01_0068980, partial [Trifolium medium]|nr:hypothetical protein [Trifolium medium]
DKKNKERKHKKDQEETAITEARKQSEQPISLEDKSAEKEKKRKKHKKTHSTSDHSMADTSIPANKEEELPKNVDTDVGLDASNVPTDRTSGDNTDPPQAK